MQKTETKPNGRKEFKAISVESDLRKQLKLEATKRENSYSELLREECSFLED